MHAVTFLCDARFNHFTDLKCNVCVRACHCYWSPLKNLLIPPGWNGCCRHRKSVLKSALLTLLISLKSIIDAQLFAAHFSADCILASNRKSSRSLCIPLQLILMKPCALKGYKTCLCVYLLDQGAHSPTASRLLCCIMLRNLEGYCGFTSPHPHTHMHSCLHTPSSAS